MERIGMIPTPRHIISGMLLFLLYFLRIITGMHENFNLEKLIIVSTRLEIFIIISETPRMSSNTNDNRCAKFSETLGDTMNSKGKIERMDAEIAKLNETIIFFKMMVEMKDEGTTKKCRVIDNVNNNKAIVSAIRDVMNVNIFPYCKFLGKKDLQTIARGSVGETV